MILLCLLFLLSKDDKLDAQFIMQGSKAARPRNSYAVLFWSWSGYGLQNVFFFFC